MMVWPSGFWRTKVAHRDRAAAAGLVLHHGRLAPGDLQVLPEQPAHQVGGAAGRRRNDDAHRFARAPLGAGGAGQGGGGEAAAPGEDAAARNRGHAFRPDCCCGTMIAGCGRARKTATRAACGLRLLAENLEHVGQVGELLAAGRRGAAERSRRSCRPRCRNWRPAARGGSCRNRPRPRAGRRSSPAGTRSARCAPRCSRRPRRSRSRRSRACRA